MLNLICKAVEKIVFSGIDGTILILPLVLLLSVLLGQAKDCIGVVRKIMREGAEDRIS
ncbi:hypothetical protein KQI38_07520 [Tissierella carlieri]|uniref:hypothetical protein n=1 Tax=Tissierella carlieri TaxID=689904 RepID=UPI001C0F7701|nr:hypothetical protein [Tissierella carlieri]MBU5311875.1 hypothetical protein [Tissierella carlieri]